MADRSDTKIRAQLQQVLSRHWIDLEKTSFHCTRGVVRMLGEIDRRDATAAPLDATKLEVIERDLTGVRGVKRVHFDFANWRRSEAGGWRPAAAGRRGGAVRQREEPDELGLAVEEPWDTGTD